MARLKSGADRFAANTALVIQDLQKSGINTLQGIANGLNARGIKTARGGNWYPTTVKNVMDRKAA